MLSEKTKRNENGIKMKEQCAEILLASYNGAQYIREQVESILCQTDERWHLTLSDDGSTDETVEILDDYVRRYPQKMTRVRSGRRFGNARDHFFWLIGQCDAAYMMTCDQDDVWYPDKVGRTLEALMQAEREAGEETPVLVFTDQTPTDAQLVPLAPSMMRYQNQYFEHFDYRSLLMQNVVTGGAMGFNRALAQLGAQCTDSTQTLMHDWWLGVVAARFGRVIYIDEPMSDYRQHASNSVGAKDVRSLSHILHRLCSLSDIRKTTLRKKRQAQVFLDTYAGRLTGEDEAFLRPFVRAHSGPLFYLKHRKLIHGFFRLAGMMTLG